MFHIYAMDELIEKTRRILRSYGYSEKEADITAHILAEADARNVPSHGVVRLKLYKQFVQKGFVFPGQEPEIVRETPVSLVVDGHNGVGPYISDFAMSRTIEKAKSSGMAFCAVRNSSHYGMAGLWAERAAKEGLMGVAMTTTRPNAIPTNGKRRMFGTNPIAVAIPEAEGKMFLLDMATTTTAFGKVRVYEHREKAMPQGWAVDEEGRPMTDAHEFMERYAAHPEFGGLVFLGGLTEATGGHKGYGLGLLVELMCAGLSDSAWSYRSYVPGKGAQVAHFFAAVSLEAFGDPAAIRSRIASILDDIRRSEPSEGNSRVYIHGEKETEAREKALKEGVPVDDVSAADLEELLAVADAGKRNC